MKEFFTKISIIFAGLVLFLAFFLAGAAITNSTPVILLYVTGINNWDYQPREQTVVYYSDGREMTRLGYQRMYSPEFPDFIKEAVVAVEDRRFYEHAGFDARGIARAILVNLKTGSKAEGGSTITQQLARTLFLGNEKTYTRKVKEVLIAAALEEKYDKEAILNMYLNEVFIGRGSSGIGAGAWIYFNKEVMSLDEAEMSLLAGMIQAPEYYSPDTNYEGLKKRQEVVLNIMAEQDIIDSARADAIINQRVYFRSYQPESSQHPYLVTYLTYLLEEQLGVKYLYRGGLSIHTSIDHYMQDAAESTVASHIRTLGNQGITARDAALVSIDPATGAVRAYVGGADFDRNQINMANQPRQPGSVIKTLYYAAALNEGVIYPDTKINNKPRLFGDFQPENDSASSPDTTDLRSALINSYNVASVEILNILGIDRGVKYLEKFGVTTIVDADKNLTLALGGMSQGISPLQMAAAYAVFPNQGIFKQPNLVQTITDVNGRSIYTYQSRDHKVITRTTAGLITEILQQAVRYGTGSNAGFAVASAGKTGTTSDSRDLWYAGYIDELATVVWVGNSDNAPVTGYSTYGGTVAAPIWRDYMNKLYYGYRLDQKPVPAAEPQSEMEESEEAEQAEDNEEPLDKEEITPEQSSDENETGSPIDQGTESETESPIDQGTESETEPPVGPGTESEAEPVENPRADESEWDPFAPEAAGF